MVSWFCSGWTFLWLLLVRTTSSDPASPPSYTIHHTSLSFVEAAKACSPGVLTTIATHQEALTILASIHQSLEPQNQNERLFWVGLRKAKGECTARSRPLRGFKWVENGGEESQLSHWIVEPEDTCTIGRCAALNSSLEGRTMTWGLVPVTCKNQYQFICKTRDGLTPPTPAPPEPRQPTTAPQPPRPPIPELSRPSSPGPEPPRSSSPEPQTSEPATQQPDTAPPESELFTPRIVVTPKPGLSALEPVSSPGSKPEEDRCSKPGIPGVRSLTLVSGWRILVECWSSVKLELQCSGHPAVWRLQDGVAANYSAVCEPCDSGFHKDAVGNCIDVDECTKGSTTCRHTCLNTEGSYRCVCTDHEGVQQDEDSATCVHPPGSGSSALSTSGILVPVLAAVGALVLLVLLVVLVVICCLRRRKRRAMKKAEKMAMKNKAAA